MTVTEAQSALPHGYKLEVIDDPRCKYPYRVTEMHKGMYLGLGHTLEWAVSEAWRNKRNDDAIVEYAASIGLCSLI